MLFRSLSMLQLHVLLFLMSVTPSEAHGAVSKPVPRKLNEKMYCPWCLGEHHPATNPYGESHYDASLSSPCMGTRRGDATYSWKNYGRYKSIAGESDQVYAAGGTFDATIILDADHGGQAQWQLCPYSEAETEECFRGHELTPWIDVHSYWNASSEISRWKSGEHYPQTVHLPSNVPEGPATLRWLWICKFTDEIFTSCIDVNIIKDFSSPTPSLSPATPAPPSAPEAKPENDPSTQAPTSEPEPEPEPEPESEPEPITASSTVFPPPAPTPAPVTTLAPSPPPVETPTPTAHSPGTTCKATPGLKRGVSDASCAKCANGYKWWPCNEAILCECQPASLVQHSVGRESKLRGFRAHFLGPY